MPGPGFAQPSATALTVIKMIFISADNMLQEHLRANGASSPKQCSRAAVAFGPRRSSSVAGADPYLQHGCYSGVAKVSPLLVVLGDCYALLSSEIAAGPC